VDSHRAQAGALTLPAVVTLPAQIDTTNADAVNAQLSAALGPGVTAVVADMTHTTFCDSSGARSLVLARNAAAARHAELLVVVQTARVLRILQVLGLNRVLSIYPSVDAALAASPPGP
jgi:anti-sigma B factor antagonist